MILQPASLALLLIALLVSGMGVYAGYYAMQILGRGDPASGSEGQLELERRTYLISTIMSYILSFELMSLFLFIYTADDIHPLFTGAMCAAGTLAVNSFGYPALLFKVVNFLLAGVWLIINHADNRGYDYPLIRVKYRLLLDISQQISRTMDLQDVVAGLLGSVRSVVDYDAAGIFVLHRNVPLQPTPDTNVIAAMASVGFGHRAESTDPMLRTGKGIVGHVIRTGETVVAPDVSCDPHYIQGRAQTRSEQVKG